MKEQRINELESMVANDYRNITGVMVLKDGKTIFENYFNGYDAKNTFHVYSVTKSIFSALIGIAIEEGKIKSVDQLVLDFFPDYEVLPGEKTIQQVTLKNLLTMTAPYKFEMEPYEEYFTSDNWIKFGLDSLGGNNPIGEFKYSPIVGTHILAGILTNATKEPVLEYATKHLFEPLGIKMHNVAFHSKEEQLAWYEKRYTDSEWVVDPQGINTASWGLVLSLKDIAKIGQLYLDQGVFEGKQIIPSKWIKECTKEHATFGDMTYGYLWWLMNEKEHAYAALGDGGNVLYINEEKKMVVSITGLFMPDIKDSLELILQNIEPLFATCVKK